MPIRQQRESYVLPLRLFLQLRPGCHHPLLDGGFIALAGADNWSLRTPAHLAQQRADIIVMILYAKPLANELGNPFRGPNVATKPMSFSALRQFGQQFLLLLYTQSRRRPRRLVMSQRRNSTSLGTLDDIADRSLRQPQRINDCLLL